MKKIFLLFLILFSFANAFEIDLISNIQTDLEIYNNSVLFGCENGELYSVNMENSKTNWVVDIGSKPGNDILILDNLLIIYSGNTAYFYQIDNGSLKDIYSFSSNIYGVNSDNRTVYFSTSDGVYAFSKDISLIWSNQLNCNKTKPIVNDYSVYFACENTVYSLNKIQGEVLWQNILGTPINIKEGDLRVFISTSDNKIKTLEITEGKETWNYKAGGWITNIKDSEGVVFFISNDYYIYAVNADDGNLLWKKYIGDMTQLDVNENIVLIGTKNYEIYGLNRKTGDREFILYTSDWPENIKIKDNLVLYSTLDRKLVSSYIDQVCTFEYPKERSLVSSAEFKLNGTVYSIDNSVNKIQIGLIENDEGIYHNTHYDQQGDQSNNTGDWTAYVDPFTFNDGLITVSCKIYPYENRTQIKRQLIKTPQPTLIEDMNIKYQNKVEVQQNTQIYALNKYNQTIKGATALYNSNEYQADSNGYMTLFFDAPGIKTVEISRKGYETQTIKIQVGDLPIDTDDYTLFYLAGIVLLIVIIVFLIKKIKR